MTAPSRTVVADSSLVVAALADSGEPGDWARGQLAGSAVVAPTLLPFEVSSALRSLEASGTLPSPFAQLLHNAVIELPADFWDHAPYAGRAWELRHSLSYYDACYVALAELLELPLVTLDARIARAHGPRCQIVIYP